MPKSNTFASRADLVIHIVNNLLKKHKTTKRLLANGNPIDMAFFKAVS